MNCFGRWLRQPQAVFLRRAVFQIHLWTGLAIGLYVIVLCVTGSILVYRNELYIFFSPKPLLVAGSGAPLAIDDLKNAAGRQYAGYEIEDIRPGKSSNQAVEVTLRHGQRLKRRLFNPFTGADLGDPLPFGFRATAWLRDLHDNLLYGRTGRRVNGVGAALLVVLSLSGAVIWWPGIRGWRRSLIIERASNWRRVNWSVHSALGFWFFAFVLMWAVTGLYLSFPALFSYVFDYLEPYDPDKPERFVDSVEYWLAYLHFGRLGGRGIPGCGRGLCDSMTKFGWAVFGMVPPVMVATGAIMWWNRVLAPFLRQPAKSEAPEYT